MRLSSLLLTTALAAALQAAPIVAPEVAITVDPGQPHAATAGDILLRWAGELHRHYRVETTTDLVNWKDFSEVVGLGRECRILARRHTPTGSEAAKFWRVTSFDVDTDGDGTSDHDEAATGADPFAGTRITLRSDFVPFGLCLSNSKWSLTSAEQISFCQARGFKGYGLASFGSEAALKAFADHPEVSSGRFRIYSAMWWLKVTSEFDWATIDQRLAQAARMDMAIWVVVEGAKTAANIETAYAILKTAAQHCAAQDVRLVLYPHQGTTFATAEEALALLLRLRADPDLTTAEKACASISVHLCHELKARNGDRIADVVAAVAPYCTLASISGAEADTANRSGWDSGIEPLDQGTYDVRPFLQALADAGYTGPMEYHTYNLPDPREDDHFARTLLRWHQLVAPPTP